MFTTSSYNHFFRQCAVKHISILHNALAEGQDGPVSECGFFLGIDKAINGIRNQITSDKCTLIVMKYECKGRENGAFDYRALYNGGFIVCKAADPSDSNDVEAAEVRTEEAAWDIINSIIQRQVSDPAGNHCGSPFGEIDLNAFTITHIGPFLDKQYGWYVEFDFLIERNALINTARIATQFP